MRERRVGSWRGEGWGRWSSWLWEEVEDEKLEAFHPKKQGKRRQSKQEREEESRLRAHLTSFLTPCFFNTLITVSSPPASSKTLVLVGESARAQKRVSRRLEASGVGRGAEWEEEEEEGKAEGSG